MKQYEQLTIEEREKIQKGLWDKRSIRSIAHELGRSPSSISRELKRNATPTHQLRYTPRLAQERAKTIIKQRGARPRLKDIRIKRYVIAKLKADYSPEQIAGTLPETYPDLHISPEAIYQFIYAQYRRSGYGECIGLDLRNCLKRKHKVRRPKKTPYASVKGQLQGITRIDERPAVVEKRSRIGDWEADAMVSKKSLSGLNTSVERKSGYVKITKLKRVSKEATTHAVIKALRNLPHHTLTVDNGKENAGFKDIERALGTKVYFAHPYCSGQRGTNENTNGLIRYYLPKGTDFATVHPNTLKAIERKLNNRPRKRLKWKTPQQIIDEVLH